MVRSLFQYYLDNQANLVKQFDGKFLVITEEGVSGAYDREDLAYYAGKSKYGLGSFIVQLCTPGEEAYTQHFFSPIVVF